ncbi:SGNH hydrolase, partial [Raphidocelis subcapitata]
MPRPRPALAAALLLALCGAAAAADAAADMSDAAKERSRAAASEQWHGRLHRLAALRVDDFSVADLLGPVLRHRYELPPTQVKKSLVYLGANQRLRRVVHDLLVGRPISIGAIGGSITHGAKASKIGETDWFSLVTRYMRDAFPRSNVTARNGALPATPSALMNMCLETYVDSGIDLLFVEYCANDGSDPHDRVKPKVYERLLRKILQ